MSGRNTKPKPEPKMKPKLATTIRTDPRILKSTLTDRWYVVTRYKVTGQDDKGRDLIEALKKHDVTDQIANIIEPAALTTQLVRMRRAISDAVLFLQIREQEGVEFPYDSRPLRKLRELAELEGQEGAEQ